MLMTEGQAYRCQNRACNCEVVVTKPSSEGPSNPRCCCGSEMKKPYLSPVMRELTSNVLVEQGVNGN